MKKITIPTLSLRELLKHTPSALFRAARYRGGAGVHADQKGRYTKRDRAKNRHEERLATVRRDEAE